MKKTILTLAGMILLGSTIYAQESAIVIFDGSGSMKKKVNGKAKFKIAQEVMGNLVKNWNKDTKLGLMVYGHRSKSCDDIEMLIPMGTVNPDEFTNAIKRIHPKGETPIAQSLKQAAEQLNYIESPTTIILISDGEESCNADPCAVAKELEKKGIDFTTHVIGFDVDAESQAKAKEQLQCIAKETGGEFFKAKDAEGLKIALAETVKVIEKPTPISIKPTPLSTMKVVSVKKVHGIDNPLTVELETIYKFRLKKNEESYCQLLVPIGKAKIFLDKQLLKNYPTNLQSTLSLVDEDGIEIKDNVINFNEVDIGYRKEASLSLDKPAIIGFRVLNGSAELDFWLTVLKNNDTQLVPFFGNRIPIPATVDEKKSGKLKEHTDVYYAIDLEKGNYKIVVDFINSKKNNTNIQGYVALLNPDGSKQTEIININETDIHTRQGTTVSIEKKGKYIFRIENNSRTIDYKLKIRKK